MSEAFITYTKKLPVKKEYDVIVCGGGVAGVAAAVSAAQNGCSVLLLEKSNLLGGLGSICSFPCATAGASRSSSALRKNGCG